MARKVAIGKQDFAVIREKNLFYVDKTYFIRDWWNAEDDVTLLCRPRRFGKTLTLSMVNVFFSNAYFGRGDLFEGLLVWQDEAMRAIQGTYPVISLTFSTVKERTYAEAVNRVRSICEAEYRKWARLFYQKDMYPGDYEILQRCAKHIESGEIAFSILQLSEILGNYYGKRVLVLLDEYDTPLLEAFQYGYWDEMISFLRAFFNASFKANPHLERALMTGITRIAHENMFSDFNNPRIVTVSSTKYETAIGFTEEEVFEAMDELGMPREQRRQVREWYDGFIFGRQRDIYNPWSIINYLSSGIFLPYWSNTSSNALVEILLQPKRDELREYLEHLLRRESIVVTIDEKIVLQNLHTQINAVWSLLYTSGYLKALHVDLLEGRYELAITNGETWYLFRDLVNRWFAEAIEPYNDFQKALLNGDVCKMNRYLSIVLERNTSCYDGGKKPSDKEPERFYHGLVLGLLVSLDKRFEIQSNGESGYGRYDILLKPKDTVRDHAIIIEFKIQDEQNGEKTLKAAVDAGLAQIESMKYESVLLSAGIPAGKIRKYCFAFKGKQVLIG